MEHLPKSIIDHSGQLTLSFPYLQKLDWNTGDTISGYKLDPDTIVLRLSERYKASGCVLCNNHQSVTHINGRGICKKCLEIIKNA